ncbi:hypothetical protein [Phyllobacterium sp. P30BS-XVII]|uniref:hypothetical protein n=1 Tax=Phyllobacterium sp. P30BS-XVII TaxID=2587046 RepID=UPI0015FB888E|nr:hypothetical protein [Phyllobacterium sp. P30BS-XVII]MBA8903460.1 hypothetical protein [Phyllobacterium sp. P30BS-XVII]
MPGLTFLRALGCSGLIIMMTASGASAENLKEFHARDGSYSYKYPGNFGISTMFADGTGDPMGVTASTPENGDVLIEMYSMNIRAVKTVTEQTMEAYAAQYVSDLTDRKTHFVSRKPTQMFGRLAVDMTFDEAMVFGTSKTMRTRRIIATIAGGKDYFLICLYRNDRTQFAPACETAAKTARLTKGG